MTQQVIVDINTPLALNKSGDHRTAVILSTVLPPKKDRIGKNGVWNRYQITSLFYATVQPGDSKPVITKAKFKPNEVKAESILELQISNTGSKHSRVKGVIGLKAENNHIASQQPFETVLLNDQVRNFEIIFPYENLDQGEYSVFFDLTDHGQRLPTTLPKSAKISIH